MADAGGIPTPPVLKPTLADRSHVVNVARIYTKMEFLGSGSYGDVFKAWKPDGTIVAIKLMWPHITIDPWGQVNRSEDKDKEEFILVHDLLRTCSHPGLICYHSIRYVIHDEEEKICLEMDYLPGSNLGILLSNPKLKLTVMQVHKFAKHLFSALAYIHSRGVAHRDLKPANIMFTTDRLVMVDFGLSCLTIDKARLPELACDGILGTRFYLPPEFNDGVPVGYSFMYQDMYAMGLILRELLEHIDGPITRSARDLYSISAACTAYKYEDRPSAEQCLKLLTTVPVASTTLRYGK